MDRIYFLKQYLTGKYGHPLYRIPIDLPFSCPNRVANSGDGCIFCADDGARARHLKHNLDLKRQVAEGISYAERRYNARPPYIAYFQSFTNTFAPVAKIRELYSEVLGMADFKMVITATRPDCLPDDVLDYLAELNSKYDLWVELGVQTSSDKTLRLIRRGHDFQAVKDAAERLAERGIKCAAHVILGLPGETMEDFRKTAEDIAALPFSGVKIHNLLVLKNTPLAKMYADKHADPPVKPMNEYEYAEALAAFLRLLPDNWPVMRLTAEADPQDTIAPKWWMKKGQFIEYFQTYFEQGKTDEAAKVKTGDGSYTLYHPEYRQHFHTLAGAASETENKFIKPCRLGERLQTGDVKLLDIGFGLGYNAAGALKTAQDIACGRLEVITLEHDLNALRAALGLFPENSFEAGLISALLKKGFWAGEYGSIRLITGDARQIVAGLDEKFDCIFMDGFSPDKNPELWSLDFISALKKMLKEHGVIATYSSAFPVRGAMLKCGLQITESDAFGRKRGGTVAAVELNGCVGTTLPEKELNIITRSTAGVPYRDPGLNNSRDHILEYRRKLIAELRKRGVPKWFKQLPA